MKEFKEIVDGIAHSLSMTVDALVKAYPHLRAEYSWYYLCGKIQIIFGVLLFVFTIASLLGIVFAHCKASDDDYDEFSANILASAYTVAFLGVVILVGIILVATAIKGFASPDVLIIQKVLDTVQGG